MSRIYFRSSDSEAYVRGTERAYASVLCVDIAKAVLYGPQYKYSTDQLRLKERFSFCGDDWLSAINTAISIGSDPLILLARLHSQCEVHCWVDGQNRKWLAEIIERGRDDEILRKDSGWENVIDLLNESDASPVVCSYSVTDIFPNISLLPDDHPIRDLDDDEADEAFYELPDQEAFSLCMKKLRSLNGLEMRPDAWARFRFSNNPTAFDLLANPDEQNEAKTGSV